MLTIPSTSAIFRMLKFTDEIYGHPYYRKAVKMASRIYIRLSEQPYQSKEDLEKVRMVLAMAERASFGITRCLAHSYHFFLFLLLLQPFS